jgi:hypothetical protein
LIFPHPRTGVLFSLVAWLNPVSVYVMVFCAFRTAMMLVVGTLVVHMIMYYLSGRSSKYSQHLELLDSAGQSLLQKQAINERFLHVVATRAPKLLDSLMDEKTKVEGHKKRSVPGVGKMLREVEDSHTEEANDDLD